MSWDEPSPRTRPSSTAARADFRPATQPGYEAAQVSFGRLMRRFGLAGMAGVLVCFISSASLAAAQGRPHASGLDLVLSLAVGFVVAALAWKYVMNRPRAYGLSDRVRNGRGWVGEAGYGADDTLEVVVAVDVVSDLIDVVMEISTDL